MDLHLVLSVLQARHYMPLFVLGFPFTVYRLWSLAVFALDPVEVGPE